MNLKNLVSVSGLLAVHLLLAPLSLVHAELRLPSAIDSHMVVQRDQPIAVWGWAAPGDEVTVGFAGTNTDATADGDGKWQVTLPSVTANSRPQTMIISDSAGGRVELTDILVGDVWLCTGPSNIFWPVKKCDDADSEISSATFPRIRFFTVKKKLADEPQQDCVGDWVACRPETVSDVSGIGYFFSRRIHRETDVPIGLLQSFWGGSRVEAWTSQDALDQQPMIRPLLADWQQQTDQFDPEEAAQVNERRLAAWQKSVAAARQQGTRIPRRPVLLRDPRTSQHRPACLFNGMIAPLIPYSMRGMICYQGLGNLYRAESSTVLLETMIQDWRNRWGQGDFPIGLVQPAPFDCAGWPASGAHAYSIQREAQLIVQQRLAGIGLAPTLDIDQIDVLHFTNKQLVAHRLAQWALAEVYGQKVAHGGPTYESMQIDGRSIRVRFSDSGSGLSTRDGRMPQHFEVAGAERVYRPAAARIEGDSVVVQSDQVLEPQAVRFAWRDAAVVNLVNDAGLPASLFCSDSWLNASSAAAETVTGETE